MARKRKRPKNWAQARAEIDRGETGDKIAHEDPATTPLGTDAEAGGVPTAGEDVARSARQQTADESARSMAQAPRMARQRHYVPWLVVGAAVLGAVIVAMLVVTW